MKFTLVLKVFRSHYSTRLTLCCLLLAILTNGKYIIFVALPCKTFIQLELHIINRRPALLAMAPITYLFTFEGALHFKLSAIFSVIGKTILLNPLQTVIPV